MGREKSAAIEAAPRSAKPGFDGLLVVCAKCRKRQGLDRREVARSLKRAFRRQGFGRNLKLVETGCLGPCPKRMLALAGPAALSRGQVQLVDPSLPAETVDDLLREAGTKRLPRSPDPERRLDASTAGGDG